MKKTVCRRPYRVKDISCVIVMGIHREETHLQTGEADSVPWSKENPTGAGDGRKYGRPGFPAFAVSLKAKQTALSAGLFVTFIWALVLISATVLRGKIEEVVSNQQFATARHVAAEIEGKINDRIDSLSRAAGRLPGEFEPALLRDHLMQEYVLQSLFPLRISVLGPDGRIIADNPPAPEGKDPNPAVHDLFRQVATAKAPRIGKPAMDPTLARPVLAIGVPVFGSSGELQAVLVGVTEISSPNFLGIISDPSLPGGSEFTVASLADKAIIAYSNQAKMGSAAPEPGSDVILDRFAAGFEGSGIAGGPDGLRRLYSGKRVPTANWVVLATLPEDLAFQPIAVMQRYLYAIAGLLTLLAILLISWLTRRTLAPLEEAKLAMGRITAGQATLAPLPIRRNDEVGQLIESFNQLVEDRQQREAALAESEQRFRQLVESAPDAIYVQTRGLFAYVNGAALRLFGAVSKEELLGRPILDRIHADYREIVAQRIRTANDRLEHTPSLEEKILRLDGMPVDVEASSVPLRYGREDSALVFLRDISERKQAVEAIQNSEADLALSRQKLRELSAHNEFRLEEERRSIAREIHDELGQLLTALKMDCSLLRRKYPEDPYLGGKIEGMVSLLDSTIDVARHVVSNLRPPALDHGIIPAFEWLAEDFSLRWEIPCRLELDAEDIILDDTRATALFRVAQESLTNVARHADAGEVVIRLRRIGSQLQLCVQDDGRGFDPAAAAQKRGFGLQGMRERAIAFDGSMGVSSHPGGGTAVTVEIPL